MNEASVKASFLIKNVCYIVPFVCVYVNAL